MTLFIDACVRKESRTRRLAQHLLERLGDTVETAVCDGAYPLDEERLARRTACCEKGDFTDPYFDAAKQFAAADTVVIAAPYYDLSFPAALKAYLERVCMTGITFSYTPEGIPRGMCRAGRLFYVTTAGGPIFNSEYGFGYVRELAQGMFGIPEVQLLRAENLDIIGNDPEEILQAAIREINALKI